MTRSVVFDVDGVLIRDGEFARILDERYGLSVERTASFFQGPFQDCVLGLADLRDSVAPFLIDWAWPGSIDDLLALWFDADSDTNDDVLELAADLRRDGVPCFVASTQERHRAAHLEHRLGLGSRFDRLFFSCHIGTKKPDRAFFDHVASEIGVSPSEILFFDDRDSNVKGARDAGWRAERYELGDDLRTIVNRHA